MSEEQLLDHMSDFIDTEHNFDTFEDYLDSVIKGARARKYLGMCRNEARYHFSDFRFYDNS